MKRLMCSVVTDMYSCSLFSVNLKMNGLSPVLKKTVRKAIERPEAVLLVRLRHQKSGRHLAVANLHVVWAQLKYPALQTLQVKPVPFRPLLLKDLLI